MCASVREGCGGVRRVFLRAARRRAPRFAAFCARLRARRFMRVARPRAPRRRHEQYERRCDNTRTAAIVSVGASVVLRRLRLVIKLAKYPCVVSVLKAPGARLKRTQRSLREGLGTPARSRGGPKPLRSESDTRQLYAIAATKQSCATARRDRFQHNSSVAAAKTASDDVGRPKSTNP